MPADASATESRELTLVGKVELKIALAESDIALQDILGTYLPPLLLKLASEHLSVRNKVIGVCQHVNTRTKLAAVQLPVKALLQQFKEHENPLIRHFDLLYVQQGIDRLDVPQRRDLVPLILEGISRDYEQSTKNAASLFNFFLRLLHSMDLPPRGSKDDGALREELGLSKLPSDAAFIAEWIGKLVLFTPKPQGPNASPGLSKEDCDFLQVYGKEEVWTPSSPGGISLTNTKVVALKFITSSAFADVIMLVPLIVASADANDRISGLADDLLKRTKLAQFLEQPGIVERLFKLYLGDENRSAPARVPLKIKILGLLTKSRFAATRLAESSKIIRQGLAVEPMAQTNGAQEVAKQGLEATKLRSHVFAFTNWIARMALPTDMASLAPAIIQQLWDYLRSQGWPSPVAEKSLSTGELASRAFAYESIGLLAAAAPEWLLQDTQLELLHSLFTSLRDDPSGSEVSLSIEHALSGMIRVYEDLTNPEMQDSLASLCVENMELDHAKMVKSPQYIAVRFANRCLPFDNIEARYVNVLGIIEHDFQRKEVIDEAKRGLDPQWFVKSNDSKSDAGGTGKLAYPLVSVAVNRFFGLDSKLDHANAATAEAYLAALGFCRGILLRSTLEAVGTPPAIEPDWSKTIDALILNDEDARYKVAANLEQTTKADTQLHDALLLFLLSGLKCFIKQGATNCDRAGGYVLEILNLLPASQYDDLAAEVEKLPLLFSATSKTTRILAARLFGVLGALPQNSLASMQASISACLVTISAWEDAIGSDVLRVHGNLLALAHYVSRRFLITEDHSMDEIRSKLIATCIFILEKSRDGLLFEAVYMAFSEMLLQGAPIIETLSSEQADLIQQKLIEGSKKGNEGAVQALALLGMQCAEVEDHAEKSRLKKIEDALYDLHTLRQPELQFTVGEGMTEIVAGWQSKALVPKSIPSAERPDTKPRKGVLKRLLDRILADSQQTKPALRQSVVIWLLCFVQFCGHLDDVQARLAQCQIAFKGFLIDRDTLNQETAARGLALIYEKGSGDLKDELIRDLIGSFTGQGPGLSGTISADTQLFDAGALPTGDGSITTYKDIMSLASEVGDASLVYRFMSLASHEAIWSSRAAFGRFGLGNILSEADTDGYLSHNPKLVPALYRYRFDPNSNVRRAMNDIWSALVKDPTKTIQMHFDAIVKDLLKSILNKEWRTRQASCAAIADLVQGRPIELYEKHLNDIWSVAFKVCDDIKESVRTAAMTLVRSLTGILTRALEAGDGSAKSADKMLKQILPFLMGPQGLESSATEVQTFARSTILQIIKKAHVKTLQPYLPELISRLLLLLSSIEPEMINYLHMNAETFGTTKEQLDDARLRHVRGSSMLEALETCLDYLDEESMAQLQQPLDNAIKNALGLPSKVGCSRILVSLSTRRNFLFKPFANHFLLVSFKQVFDRNDTIASAYAAACGYLSRLADDEANIDIIHNCQNFYFQSDEDRPRKLAGEVIHSLAKYATDRFRSFAAEVLPFIFIAKHDSAEDVKVIYEEIWNDNVGGTRTVLLYLKEIIQLATGHLQSPKWSIKHASALAVAEVASSAGTKISENDSRLVWPALQKALAGKSWKGKEEVLKAFVTFAKSSRLRKEDGDVSTQMEAIMEREAKRNNSRYRQFALEELAKLSELDPSKDMSEVVFPICTPLLRESSGDADEMDVDSKEGGMSTSTLKERTLANAVSALIRCVQPQAIKPDRLASLLSSLQGELKGVDPSSLGGVTVREGLVDSLKALFQKLATSKLPASAWEQQDEALSGLAQHVLDAKNDIERLRLKAGEAITVLAPLVARSSKVYELVRKELGMWEEKERSSQVKRVLIGALQALPSS